MKVSDSNISRNRKSPLVQTVAPQWCASQQTDSDINSMLLSNRGIQYKSDDGILLKLNVMQVNLKKV